jgi:hypothetical protein
MSLGVEDRLGAAGVLMVSQGLGGVRGNSLEFPVRPK